MKVKVGDTIHDSATEPVMVILSENDKSNISHMQEDATMYASFPCDWGSPDEIQAWMLTPNAKLWGWTPPDSPTRATGCAPALTTEKGTDMADPMLAKTSVTVRYTANDGYSSEQTFKIYPIDHNRLSPEQPLIDAVEELARLTALFGFEDKALAAFNEARQRVFDWREGRKVGAGETAPEGHNVQIEGLSDAGLNKGEKA